MRLRLTPLRALVLVMVAALSVVYILPVYVMMVTSLKTPLEITQRQYLLPSGNLQFGNFATALRLLFIQVWYEFLLALTLVTPYTTTIQVKVNVIKGSYVALYNVQMVAALLTVLVPLTFFLFIG